MTITKINRTHIVELILIAFLAMALLVPASSANAVDIALQGELEAASIEISIDKAGMTFDMAELETEATDSITITSTTVIPVVVTLESVSQKVDSWNPTLIATDPTALNLSNAQNQARLTLSNNVSNTNYSVSPVASVIPTGTGATLDGELTYPVAFGTIDETNGEDGKEVTISGKLESSQKRILSKAFDSKMVLNFAAPQ